MTQENKELLLKDLCARLPYGVMVREETILYDDKNTTSYRIKKLNYVLIGKGFSRIKGFIHDYEYIYRPYLFPLSSMSEEQKKEYCSLVWFDGLSVGWNRDDAVILNEVKMLIDFYHKNHLDWRGLIPKGLAIDATGKGIY